MSEVPLYQFCTLLERGAKSQRPTGSLSFVLRILVSLVICDSG